MKSSTKFFKVLSCILFTIAGLMLVALVTVLVMLEHGKRTLYGNAEQPNMVLDEMNETMSADALEEMAEEEDWQEGDVRYQGIHYRYNDEILTFLFMGIDKMEKVKVVKSGIDGGQSDAIFLLVLNPRSKEISVIGVNRNSMTDVDIYDENGNFLSTMTAQVTLQHGYGDGAELSCERSVETVSGLFYGLPIHGYCAINMGAIPLINDAVGGVTLTALEDVPMSSIKEGEEVHLMGMDAYCYLHNRDITSFNSAGRRLDRQKQYLSAYAQKAIAQTKEDISLPVNLYSTLSKYMVTDVSVDEVSYLVSQMLDYHFDATKIYSLQGETIENGELEEFYVDDKALYELILDVFYDEVE